MLQLNHIRENKESVIKLLAIKNYDAKEIINEVISLDDQRREAQKKLDDNLAKANTLSKKIGDLFKSGKAEEANSVKQQTVELKVLSKELGESLDNIINKLNELVREIPNIPHSSVPPGKTDDDNEVVLNEGDIPEHNANILPHWDLAAKYDIIDFELGSKITGAGFPLYKGKGAKLQRALISFFLDNAIDEGYIE